MRKTLLLSAALVFAACGESDDTPPPPPETPPAEPPAPPEPPPTPAAPTAPAAEETTEGHIALTLDGVERRFEHLPANGNRATSRITMMEASTGPDATERVKFILIGIDVRSLEYPATISRDMGAAGRGDLRAAMRIPSLQYVDAQGTRYNYTFGDSLECQSLEGMRLRCTFEAEARSRDQLVRITAGELDITLGGSAAEDARIDALGGSAADQAIDRAQDLVDRRHGRRAREAE